MTKKVFTALGLMTGTSMDGIDLSLIKSDGFSEFTTILNRYEKFDLKLQQNLMILRDKILNPRDLEKYSCEIKKIEREITLLNGEIIEKTFNNNDYEIDLIGFHGQTIYHDPQGAPLTPIFHKLVFSQINKKFQISFPTNIINIGGITNMTQIIDNGINDINIYAYDIGPGNCLIDEWVRKNSSQKIDKDGKLANSGKVNELILSQAIDNFNINSYDDSLDVKDFDLSFIKGLSLEDGCATITKFSAYLIAKGIEVLNKINNINPKINLICGGGRKNIFLIKSINEYLSNKKTKIENIDNFDFDGDFIESQAFGYLSIRSFLNLPISFPSTTRCKTETVGGVINKNF